MYSLIFIKFTLNCSRFSLTDVQIVSLFTEFGYGSSAICVYFLEYYRFTHRFVHPFSLTDYFIRKSYTVPYCYLISLFLSVTNCRYLPTFPTRRGLTQGQKPEGRFKWGQRGERCRERAETRTLLFYAAHRLTWYNVSLMRQSVSRTQMWVRARMPVYGLK